MPWNRGDPSRCSHPLPLSSWPEYGIYAFYCKGRDLIFIWIYFSLDTETTSVSLFYNIESYFVTIHRADKYFQHILQLKISDLNGYPDIRVPDP